jgi:DNA repair exonuclease SbcCD ATPase subunit
MPRPAKTLQDTSLLSAALEGLEMQRKRVEDQIAQVRAALGGRKVRSASGEQAAKPVRKRELSPEARKRIANAQKRRWAEYRKKQAAAVKEG